MYTQYLRLISSRLSHSSPFLYTNPQEVIEKHLEELCKGFKSATIFLDDKFEKTLGVYELGILERAREYAEMLYERGMGIIVVLFDCYTLRKTWNPVYGAHEAISPYAVFGEEEFFYEY